MVEKIARERRAPVFQLESGLTAGQITEALTHLGFYAGWTRATKAMTASARTLGK
jgi:4-carboxymuconolactone decarboxylase